ncbi:MAG: uroporphyrinogen-III decarboxylase-like protein [Thermoprotei archaeon]|nr:MAG: uroporphyrinogen-III decarboxylase-like protein [Thermoprotei archaeon]RLF09464.1 MAG: uroporphyrinogen-III decarboxylase-like protein [Thermoprotei archaeon]
MKEPNFDRLLLVLLREGEPDRVPFYEHFVDDEVIEAITGRPITKIDPLKRLRSREYLQILIEFYYKMGYDYVPLEVPLKLPRKNVLFAEDTAILSRERRSWLGEDFGTIESMEDFEEYPWPEPEEAADLWCFEFLARHLPEGMEIVGGVGGGILEHVVWLMGFTPFFRALYRDPKLVQKMFDRIGSLILSVDKVIAEMDRIGALRMGDDMGYRKGTFISPEMLRKYVFPWQKKCVEVAHRKGLPFILHSCGNLEAIMDDLINYVGIDAKHSFEDAIMPVYEAKERYGDKIAILGGVDVDKLARLPERELREYVRLVIRKCAPGGGYALGSGNTIANYIPPRNYLAMLEEGRKYGRYPLR